MVDCARVNDLRLRFPNRELADLVLCPGVHAVGRDNSGMPSLVDDPAEALAEFCVDRRGVWLQLHDGVRGVHVNGRPVRRMAMLRAGDSVYIDGVELLLLGDEPQAPTATDTGRYQQDPRMVLRGVGGQHHGRCFSLDQPRRIGRAADADIRIVEPGFADQHAVIEWHDEGALLRDLGSSTGIVVNGYPVRDALLKPGDQVVFDAQHRFVVESPRSTLSPSGLLSAEDMDDPESAPSGALNNRQTGQRPSSVRRMPWLLLAALMLSAALSLLLLYGAR
jgi:pSer/pThr/pTyr-binding forkhead associated (FHA) protein